MRPHVLLAVLAAPALATATAMLHGGSAAPVSSAALSDPAGRGVFRIEFWHCPPANIARLNHLQDSLWAPLFDALVDEGKLLGWGHLLPTTEEQWNWIGYWHAEDARTMDAGWQEFLNRLSARHPGSVRPSDFCDPPEVVIYSVRRGR